jgi:tripartite-type tricarboxylate transporter receptor subunit TctC
MLKARTVSAVFIAFLWWAPSAPAGESYPARPIRLIVASGPGGGLDYVARLIGPTLTNSMGQSVVVDNRPGATGSIAAELAARATPDGYTVMLMSASLIVYEAVRKTPYDLFADFAAVSQVTAAPYILVAHPRLPVKSVAELITYAKAHPRELNYFSTGNASFVHLTTEWFRTAVGIELVHVPYKGLGAAYPDLLSGRLQMGFASPAFAIPHLRSGALKPLAITSALRSRILPDLPTMIESGVSKFVVSQWIGAVAPRGTPRPVVERLHREIVHALKQPEVSASLEKQVTDAVGSAPREFGAHMKSEFATWSRVIKQAGIAGET